jgi:hypothetical protein
MFLAIIIVSNTVQAQERYMASSTDRHGAKSNPASLDTHEAVLEVEDIDDDAERLTKSWLAVLAAPWYEMIEARSSSALFKPNNEFIRRRRTAGFS